MAEPAASEVSRQFPLAALLTAGRAGDATALRTLFDRYHPRVFAQCLVATGGDRDGALDLTQETFVRAWRALGQVHDAEQFPGWLVSIALNVCRTRASREARRRQVLESFALEQDAPIDAGDALAREDRVQVVRDLLARVEDPLLRQIVLLKYADPEHTTRAIAEKLSIPHGTVTVKLMRFRAAIRRELLKALIDGEIAEEAA